MGPSDRKFPLAGCRPNARLTHGTLSQGPLSAGQPRLPRPSAPVSLGLHRLPPSVPAACPGHARPAPVTLGLSRLSRLSLSSVSVTLGLSPSVPVAPVPIIENSREFRPTRPKAGYPINPASRNEKSPPPRAMIT